MPFFLHPAGAGKERFLYHELWEDQVGDRKTFTRRPFVSASVRVELLRQASEQMQGRKVLIFDATDFFYVKRYANPIVTATGTVIAFFHEGGSGSARRLAMFGPKVELERGRWRGSFLQQDGAAFEYPGAAFDVVGDHGQKGICPVAEWPVEGRFEFDLQETTSNVEFRIYRSGGAAELYCLHLEAVR